MLQKILREPLFHFLIIGGLIFALGYNYSIREDRIVIQAQRIEEHLQGIEDRLGRPLSGEEKEYHTRLYIEDEILLQEAFRQGLDQTDERIRKRMIDKMRFSLNEEIREPTTEELQAFYRENPERYSRPATISFRHLFYQPESWDSTRADQLLEILRDSTAAPEGDDFWLGAVITGRSRPDLVREFGRDFALKLETLPPGKWQGPFRSAHGIHYVRITAKNPRQPVPFDEAKVYMSTDWKTVRLESIHSRKIEPLLEEYEIVIQEENEMLD